MKKYKLTFICLILFSFSLSTFAKTVFTYHSEDTDRDNRKQYEIEILNLSLQKTIDKYGDFELVASPRMNLKRAALSLEQNSINNFILKVSASSELLENFAYANFPVDRGIVGYRVSFISPEMKNKIENIKSLSELKKLKIGQGIGWLDTDILKYNGFNVKVVNNYDSLFNMLSFNRIDLFPRGINEIQGELESFSNIKNLDYDRTFLLYYPLPRFFFGHKSNQKLLDRIEEGLKLAYLDGSLDKVFDKYYKPSVDLLNLKDRKFYKIKNPYLENIDSSYEKYIFNPFKK